MQEQVLKSRWRYWNLRTLLAEISNGLAAVENNLELPKKQKKSESYRMTEQLQS